MHKLLQGAMRNFLGWCDFFGDVGKETQLPPAWPTARLPYFMQFFYFFFLEVDESALDDCRRGRLTESKVGRPLTATPRSTVGPGQRGRRLCVLLRCRVWSEGNGQKGRKSLACGMAQNELLPSFCSSASQWERSLEGQITRAQNHKLQQNGEGKKTAGEEKKVKKRSDIMLFVNIWLDIWWGHTVERGAGWLVFPSYHIPPSTSLI